MKLIDSHAHVTFDEYKNDLEDVIKRSLDSNTQIINASSNYKNSVKAVELAEKHEGMWAIVGCHPIDLTNDFVEKSMFEGEIKEYEIKKEEFNYDKYLELAKSSKKIVGIGEVGLDFFKLADDENPIEKIKKDQVEYFKKFIQLAKQVKLPLVLHCRGEEGKPYEAYDLMLDILKFEFGSMKSENCGVIHCYGGNFEQAKEFLDLGFYIGITGIVTFRNAKELQEIVKEIPLEKLLIETDAPFLSPDPFRGKRNEPAYVKYVVQKIADIKEISLDKVANQTYKNTVKLFDLK